MTLSLYILSSILLSSITVNADMAFAKMQAQHAHKTEDLVKSFSATKMNVTDKNQLVDLTILADEAFDIETISSPSANPAEVTAQNIVHQIKVELGRPSKWKEKLPSASLQKLAEKKIYLQKILGEESIEWAWVLNQLGEKKKAKEIVKNTFEAEYKEVMTLTQALFGMGGSPLSELQTAFEALESLSNDKELSDYQEKMKKAKIHIGKLPQSHIMT